MDGSSGPEVMVSGQNDPYGLAVDGSNLYWTDSQGFTVWRADLDDTDAEAIATDQASPGASQSVPTTCTGPPGGLIDLAGQPGRRAEAIVETGAEVPFGVASTAPLY